MGYTGKTEVYTASGSSSADVIPAPGEGRHINILFAQVSGTATITSGGHTYAVITDGVWPGNRPVSLPDNAALHINAEVDIVVNLVYEIE